jgi:hypothetical protein
VCLLRFRGIKVTARRCCRICRLNCPSGNMQSTVVFVWMLVLPASAHWWLIGQDLIEQSKRYGGAFQVSCSKYHLTAEQKRQCDDPGNRDFVISMGQGVNIVAQHCNITFKNRQWNCPYVGGSHPFTRIAYQGEKRRGTPVPCIFGYLAPSYCSAWDLCRKIDDNQWHSV